MKNLAINQVNGELAENKSALSIPCFSLYTQLTRVSCYGPFFASVMTVSSFLYDSSGGDDVPYIYYLHCQTPP